VKVHRSLGRACALLIVVAFAACTTTPEKDAPASRPPETSAAAAVKPPAPPPKPKPVPPPPKEAEPAATPPPSKGVEELRRGVQRYDDGQYKEAARHFQQALEQGLASPVDQANARKHLAFIACVARRTTACRAEFRKAFEADPAFDLTLAEAGHPMWGPVFRSVKAELAKKRKPAAPGAPAPATSR
jgi:type IV secretory pathway VirB10-like protein